MCTIWAFRVCAKRFMCIRFCSVSWLEIYAKPWGEEIVVSFIFGMGVNANYGMSKNDLSALTAILRLGTHSLTGSSVFCWDSLLLSRLRYTWHSCKPSINLKVQMECIIFRFFFPPSNMIIPVRVQTLA